MSTVLYRTGPRQAILAAVVAALLTAHPTLLHHTPAAATLLLAAAGARWLYSTAVGVWALTHIHPIRTAATGVLLIWGLTAILSSGETHLIYQLPASNKGGAV